MLVIAHHDVKDPQAFWTKAQEVTSNLPPNLKVLSVFPSKDMKLGTCIWEAPSVNDVQQFLDENAGDVSKNTCYEVDEATAMGLPNKKAEAATAN
ncbi:MAG: hypothetical protein JWN83_1921 [Chitinophagaceae bacterium]|nr:hypothetical protein [Chitinophagaceae bacterium]